MFNLLKSEKIFVYPESDILLVTCSERKAETS